MAKANSKLFLVLLLGVLSAFGPFVVDLYLPSLPQLASFFETSASMTQLTLTTAMIGLAVGQLLLGPLSDKFGRKIPLIISLVIYIISTVLIVYAPNIEAMIVLRVIQGLSSAGSVVISRAVATDLYRGREMTRFFGLLMTIKGSIFSTFLTFDVIIKNRLFMSYVGIQSFLLGSMFAYIAASPFIFQSFYGLSAFIFSLCFGANGAALVIGANIGGKLPNRKALAIGVFAFVVAALYTIAVLIIQPNWLFVEIGFFAMLLLMGITFPAISSLAMESERQYAGSASALLGFAPFFLGGVVSPLVGIGNIFYSTALVILACSVLALVIYWMVRHKIPISAE